MSRDRELIDFIFNEMDETSKETMKQEINQDSELDKNYQEFIEVLNVIDVVRSDSKMPSENLRSNFYRELEKAKQSQERKPKILFINNSIKKIGAIAAIGIILIVAIFLVSKNSSNNPKNMDYATFIEMNEYLESPSVSNRIKAVQFNNQFQNAFPKVLEALLNTAKEDENSNVRLAAVEALSKYTESKNVIESLAFMLQTENDPVVKIAIINILSNNPNEIVKSSLEQVLLNDENPKFIMDEAHSGLNRITVREIY